MMKEILLKTAKDLAQPTETAFREFADKHEQLAAMGSQAMNRRPDVNKLVGENNQAMAEDNNRNFARFMLSLFEDYHPEVFVETVLWVFRAYRSHGFRTTYWAANLNIWSEMLKKELTQETYERIFPFYNWLIINIPIFVKLTDEVSDADTGNIPSH